MRRYLSELLEFVEKENISGLRELSNRALEEALIAESKELINLSLLSYALSKMLTKIHFKEHWPRIKEQLISALREERPYSTILEELLNDISLFDKEFGNYVINIVEKARLKQASRAYALGMSIGRAAEITGCDPQELQDYIGKTKIHERPFSQTRSIRERYRYIKEFFGE